MQPETADTSSPLARRSGPRLLRRLRTHSFFLGLILVVFLAPYFPEAGRASQSALKPLIALSLFFIGMRQPRGQFASAGRPLPILFTMLNTFVAMPLISFALATLLYSGNETLYIGCILVGSAATTQASSIIWTDLAGGNRSLALVLMTISNILGTFLMPVLLWLQLGQVVELPVLTMIGNLVLLILLPAFAGVLLKHLTAYESRRFDALSRLFNLLVIWLTIFTALSQSTLPPLHLAAIAAASAVQYSLIAAVSYKGARLLGMSAEDALAVMFSSSQKTITVAALIAVQYFGAQAIIYGIVYHVLQQFLGQGSLYLLLQRR